MRRWVTTLAIIAFFSNISVAQNVQYAIASTVEVGATPDNPNHYTWSQVTSTKQTIYVGVEPPNYEELHFQQNNSEIILHALDTNSIITRLEIRWNYGAWQLLYQGSGTRSYKLTPPVVGTLGRHTLEFRWINVEGSIYYRRHTLVVVPTSARLYKDNVGNTLTVWESNPSSTKNPVLVVEGYDAYNRNYAEYYRYASAKVADELIRNGHRVYYLNFRFNGQDMRNSAAIFNSALKHVSALSSNKTVYAVGVSMGGVIARYALAKAEGVGTPLPAAKFISIDAPQQGAVISQDLQNFLFYDACSFPEYSKHGLKNTAAQQLLYYNVFGSQHNAFYNELRGLNGGQGYPMQIRKVAVSFSNGSPNSNSGTWLTVTYKGVFGTGICGANQNLVISSNEALPGSFLPRDITDAVPERIWSAWLKQTRHSDPTFIPYVSALDLVGSSTKFDKLITSGANRFHDQLPDDVADPILQEFGLRYPINASISGQSQVPLGQTGTWTAVVSGGTPYHSYRWEYQRECSGGGGCDPKLGCDPALPAGGDGDVTQSVSTTSSDEEKSTKESELDDAVIMAEPCYTWFTGSYSSTFSKTFNTNDNWEIRLTITDSSSPVQTKTVYKSVTSGYGGTFAAAGSINKEAVSIGASLAAFQETIPETHVLDQSAPNPFSMRAEIHFGLPETSSVQLIVYDLLGREVKRLIDQAMSAGYHQVTFEAGDLPSGVYLYRITAGDFSQTRRMVLTK